MDKQTFGIVSETNRLNVYSPPLNIYVYIVLTCDAGLNPL